MNTHDTNDAHFRNGYLAKALIAKTMLICVAIFSLSATTSNENRYLKHFYKLPTSTQLSHARDLYEENPDSALIYYSILSSKYSSSLDKIDKENCLSAILEKWEITFFDYFDYNTAFQCLTKANEISEDLGKRDPRIDLYYGCMYHTLYEQTKVRNEGEKAFQYFSSAFNEAYNKRDINVIRMSIGNLIEVAHSLGKLHAITMQMEAYKSLAKEIMWPGYKYDIGLYEGLLNAEQGNLARYVEIFKKLVGEADKLGHPRYKYAAMTGIISGYKDMGNFRDALNWIETAEKTFCRSDFKDGQLMLYRMKAECLDSLGRKDEAKESMYNYVMLKDSLLNFNQVSAIRNSEFIESINDYEKQLYQINMKKQILLYLSFAGLIIILVISWSWYKLHRKNTALNSANISLYNKNIELLNREKELALSNKNATPMNVAKTGVKYKNSVVSDSLRDILWDNIINILSNNRMIFEPEFSIDRLAELCNSKTKYVSQVINEHGDNFSTLLNRYRIKEACNLMTPETNLTIEAIANDVGFRSVNAFRTSFKHITGLLPSVYLKIAREKRS